MTVTVRLAKVSDAPQLVKLFCEDLGYACTEALVRVQLERALQTEHERVFVAEYQSRVVGVLHAEDYNVLYFETMKNVLGLAVAGDCRRMGIGTKLLGALEDWARETGVKTIRLNSGMSRAGAHEFYRANGFTGEKDQKRFLKTL